MPYIPLLKERVVRHKDKNPIRELHEIINKITRKYYTVYNYTRNHMLQRETIQCLTRDNYDLVIEAQKYHTTHSKTKRSSTKMPFFYTAKDLPLHILIFLINNDLPKTGEENVIEADPLPVPPKGQETDPDFNPTGLTMRKERKITVEFL